MYQTNMCCKYFWLQWNLDYPNLVYPHARLSELIFGAFIRLIRYSVFNYSMNIIIGWL